MSPGTLFGRSLVQLRHNPLRTLLTLLGIVFGVGAVVAMMSIGEGAQRALLARIEAMGSTTVHVLAKEVPPAEITETINDSQGLRRDDAVSIRRAMPGARAVAWRVGHQMGSSDLGVPLREVNVIGISQQLPRAHALGLGEGRGLVALDHARAHRVALLGQALATRAFGGAQQALGQVIRLDYAYFEVVGVLAARPGANLQAQKDLPGGGAGSKFGQALGGGSELDGATAVSRSYDMAVLIPYATLREQLLPQPGYKDVDMISVVVQSTAQTLEAKRALEVLMGNVHRGVEDVEIVAPEEILRQIQEVQSIFNFVLMAIAAISLLVGGIGVMNIMLANIIERIGEIGLRRAVGARKRDIRNQFLIEAVTLCVVGGVVGIGLGLGVSFGANVLVDLPFAFAWESTLLAFGISSVVGVTFGLVPAIRASNINPIDALRGEA